MTDSSFRSALVSKDRQTCQQIITSTLSDISLIRILNDLLYCSIFVQQNSIINEHPVCTINSIKNLIGDDRENPSEALLNFSIDYLCEFKFRKNDQLQLDKVMRDGVGLTGFLGDLEDACQNGEWSEVQVLASKIFMASDQSRGVMDALAELGLQDSDRNANFIFHLFRAYQFQEVKEDNWAFTKCILEWMDGVPLPDPHDKTDSIPSQIFDSMLKSGNLTLLSSVSRLWDGDYVRIRGYRRELSHWCFQVLASELSTKSNQNHWILKKDKRKFISAAEKIIRSEKSQSEKAKALVILEAVRALTKTVSQTQLEYLGGRLDQSIL